MKKFPNRNSLPFLKIRSRSSITEGSIDDKVFSGQRQTGGSGRKSSGAQHLPPQATNYRATLAERFNTRFGGGRSPSPPTLLLGSTLPLARPTVARPTLWLPTAMNNGAAENR